MHDDVIWLFGVAIHNNKHDKTSFQRFDLEAQDNQSLEP